MKQVDCTICREQHLTHNPAPPEGGLMEKASDLIGSVRGIALLTAIEIVYMIAGTAFSFDAYPFAFFTLLLSLIALTFSQVIMVVQNRQGAILEAKAATERQQVADDLSCDQRQLELLTALYDKFMVGVSEG